MPSALIKITQGATTDVPGRALIGRIDGVTTVVFSNGDNSSVVNWKYELLDVPPGSAIALTTQDGVLATFTMATPDKPGSYRMKLTTRDASGAEEVDIRNFCVPFPNVGYIAPPYQGSPPPLPLTGVGSKPDEMNVVGQAKGWAGDAVETRKLLYQLMKRVDEAGLGGSLPDFVTNNAVLQVAGVLSSSALPGDGLYSIIAYFHASEATDKAFYGEVLAFTNVGGTLTQIASSTQLFTPLESGGAGAWNVVLGSSGTTIEFRVQGAVGDTITWSIFYEIRCNRR